MKPSLVQLQASVPNKTSSTAQWIAWDELNRAYFGKSAARNLFAIAATENGFGSDVNKERLREVTGYAIDDTSLKDALVTTKDDILDIVQFGGTTTKVVLLATVSIAIILVAGVVIRLVTIKPQDAGILAGTTIKYAK